MVCFIGRVNRKYPHKITYKHYHRFFLALYRCIFFFFWRGSSCSSFLLFCFVFLYFLVFFLSLVLTIARVSTVMKVIPVTRRAYQRTKATNGQYRPCKMTFFSKWTQKRALLPKVSLWYWSLLSMIKLYNLTKYSRILTHGKPKTDHFCQNFWLFCKKLMWPHALIKIKKF
jgi:hypothetical protein